MKAEKFLSSEAKQILANYTEATAVINETIQKNGWRIEGEAPSLTFIHFLNSSLNERKKLRDLIYRVITKPSMKSINKLFSYVKNFTKSQKSCHVRISAKEEKIQIARKKWKAAQAIADQYLQEYKTEKGDYYKK